MQLNEIKKYLHHREPYLMLSSVIDLNESSIHSECVHRGDEAHLPGHFPGAPVVPGAMLQEMCTQSAALLITKFHAPVEAYDSEKTKGHALGVLNKVEFAKYLEIVRPSEKIEAKVELIEKEDILFKFKAKIFQNGQVKAKLKFNLVNISDSHITE